VANPNPPLENLRPQPWQKGQSGNPKGYSKKRRATDALERYIDEHGLDNAIGRRWLGAALDEPGMLDTIEEVEVLDKDGFPVLDKDGKPKTKKRRYRSRPNAHFFAMLLERLEGKVPQPPPPSDDDLSDAEPKDDDGNPIEP
jgi:hypothetical protein